MIALLLALLADPPAPIDDLPIDRLAPQALPARGCAAYLFTNGATRTLAAVANADPGSIRLSLDGKVADYPRAAQAGEGGYGFAGVTEYRLGEVSVTLDMTIAPRSDLTDGALISIATLRIDRPGKDGIVVPMGGLIGCAKQ